MYDFFTGQIRNWFQDEVKQKDLNSLYQAMLSGKAEVFEQELAVQLQSTISYMGCSEVICYGVAFFKKQVRICMERRALTFEEE